MTLDASEFGDFAPLVPEARRGEQKLPEAVPLRPSITETPTSPADTGDFGTLVPKGASTQLGPSQAQPEQEFGDFADLVPQGGPSTPFTSYVEAAGKSLVKGAAGQIAAPLKEVAEKGVVQGMQNAEIMDRIDRGEQVPQINDIFGYGDMSPQDRQDFKNTYSRWFVGSPAESQQTLPYRAGAGLEAATNFQMPKGFEGQTWTGDIASGVGLMATGIGMSLIPFVGPMLAGGSFVMAGQNEARERAQQAGATLEQQERAAHLGTIAGAMDLVDIALPFVGSFGKALNLLGRIGVSVAEKAFIEGGQEGLQQLFQNWIAQNVL